MRAAGMREGFVLSRKGLGLKINMRRAWGDIEVLKWSRANLGQGDHMRIRVGCVEEDGVPGELLSQCWPRVCVYGPVYVPHACLGACVYAYIGALCVCVHACKDICNFVHMLWSFALLAAGILMGTAQSIRL